MNTFDTKLTKEEILKLLALEHGKAWVDMFVLETDDFELIAVAARFKATHTKFEWDTKMIDLIKEMK